MRALIILSIAFVMTACGGKKVTTETGKIDKNSSYASEFANAPKWVTTGCASIAELKGNLCGLGSAPIQGDLSMSRTMSMNRGRTEIAKALQTRVKAMVKDYQARTSKEGKGTTDVHVEAVSKSVTDVAVNGVVLKDTWISGKDNLYALMILDAKTFTDSLEQIKDLNGALKNYIRENAKTAFDELDKETSKN